VANTLAYCDTARITAVKGFVVHAASFFIKPQKFSDRRDIFIRTFKNYFKNYFYLFFLSNFSTNIISGACAIKLFIAV
jgi:hypothetical protein